MAAEAPPPAHWRLCVQDQQENEEWLLHFRDLPRSITSLLVLLTTANNPDGTAPEEPGREVPFSEGSCFLLLQ